MHEIAHKLLNLLIVVIFCLLVTKTYAHENGPSYIAVNGKLTVLNAVHALAHQPGFLIATDLAPENFYLTNTPITFTIDQKNYFTPENRPAEFRWDFQDNTSVTEGVGVTHKFAIEGSYFVILQARDNNKQPFRTVDTVQINIVSSEDYQPPVAQIKINGSFVNSYKAPQHIELGKPVSFDASSSIGNNLRYFWEFGDDKRSKDKIVEHTFIGVGESTFFPLLRVVDEKNISHDVIVSVTSAKITPTPVIQKQNFLNYLVTKILDFIRSFFIK